MLPVHECFVMSSSRRLSEYNYAETGICPSNRKVSQLLVQVVLTQSSLELLGRRRCRTLA